MRWIFYNSLTDHSSSPRYPTYSKHPPDGFNQVIVCMERIKWPPFHPFSITSRHRLHIHRCVSASQYIFVLRGIQHRCGSARKQPTLWPTRLEHYYIGKLPECRPKSGRVVRNKLLQTNTLPNRCNIYARPKVPFHMERVQCLFEASMCAVEAVAFNSGLADLTDTFRLNLRTSDQCGTGGERRALLLP